MAFAPRSAKNAKVRFNGQVIAAKSWTVTPEIEGETDVTPFDGILVDGLMCVQILAERVKVSFQIELDANAMGNIYDSTSGGITAGNDSVSLILYLNDVGSPFWSFPTPMFKSVPMVANVRDVLKHTITGMGSGSFSYPTGNF